MKELISENMKYNQTKTQQTTQRASIPAKNEEKIHRRGEDGGRTRLKKPA
jgi:hypothetical protein